MIREMTEQEEKAYRARIHNLADAVQRHETILAEHKIMIDTNGAAISEIRGKMSTREQLEAAVATFGSKLEHSAERLTTQIAELKSDLAPIKSGIYGIVWLVLASIVLALLGLVIVKTGMVMKP